MSKKFNIREWVLSVKYWSLLFIPHIAICLIFLIYTLVGTSIIQEIESDDTQMTSSIGKLETDSSLVQTTKNFDRDRERLLSRIIDKRQTVDVQQYAKYVTKQIREYEEEIKKSYKLMTITPNATPEKVSTQEENLRWTFSGSLYFIGTTLTTIGSNEFTPVTKIGKLFLMIYAAIGIPLTLVFLSDLSLLITRLIKYLSLILLRIYSTKYFRHIRQWMFFRFIEKQLDISISTSSDDEDIFSVKQQSTIISKISVEFYDNDPTIQQLQTKLKLSPIQPPILHLRNIYNILSDTIKDINDNIDLTMPQLIITLFIYILIGACLISSSSYFDGIYICFTSLFSINLRNFYRQITTSQEHQTRLLFIVAIYLLFGLAIVSLCIKAVQLRIQLCLENLGKKILRDLVEFLRQMGFHELSTDDILAATDLSSPSFALNTSDINLSRPQRLPRTTSANQSDSTAALISNSNARPIGVAEPLRRASTAAIIRSLKSSMGEIESNTDKSVQVNTIIRSCGRCAGSSSSSGSSILSLKKHTVVSSSPSPTGDLSSGCEDDDPLPSSLAPPNLDRLRQRRATLVAKTIIHQMATQPSMSSPDESMPPIIQLTTQRIRPAEPSSATFKYSLNSKTNSSPESLRSRGRNQEEFLEISKQISSLLTPSDDEN